MPASLAEKSGYLGYPGCIGVLALLALVCACAGPQSPAESAFEEGTVSPEALIPIARTTARTQTFVADSERVVELQLLVARSADAGDEPLLVEVRNVHMDRRFGYGSIPAFEGEPFVATWRSVEWEERPVLERDEPYVLVFKTDSEGEDWLHAVAQGTYPHGTFAYPWDHDFDTGFRIKFESAVTHSVLSSTREPITFYPIEGDNDRPSWGERYYLPLDERDAGKTQPQSRVLPRCDSNRCFDATASLWGSADERAVRSRDATRSCGEAPVESLYFERGVLGVSCRDVCKGHDFAECVGTQFVEDVCEKEPYHNAPISPSCDSPLSASSQRALGSCMCSNKPLERELSSDPEVVRERVTEHFELDGERQPRLKPGRIASGLTCSQVCAVLGPESCEDHEDCSREVGPAFSACPACVTLATQQIPEDFKKTSVRVGNQLITTYGGKLQGISPDTGETRSYSAEDLDLSQASVAARGRYAIWSFDFSRASKAYKSNPQSPRAVFAALDTLSGEMHRLSVDVNARQCKFGVHPKSLEGRGSIAAICRDGDSISIHEFERDRRIEAPYRSISHVRSWDGKTLVFAWNETSEDQYSWSVGDSEWTREDSPDFFRRLSIWSPVEDLKSIIASSPDRPNVMDEHYYGTRSEEVWRYNSKTEVFERWTLPQFGEDSLISKELIRAGKYVLDRDWEVFKRVSLPLLLEVGSYAFIEAWRCPEHLACRTLEAPLDSLAIVDLRVEDYESDDTREGFETAPDDPERPGPPKVFFLPYEATPPK